MGFRNQLRTGGPRGPPNCSFWTILRVMTGQPWVKGCMWNHKISWRGVWCFAKRTCYIGWYYWMDILNCSKGRKDYCRWCTNVASGQQIRSIAALEKCILVQKSEDVWFHWSYNKLSDGYGKSELPMEGPTKLIKLGHDISTYKPRIYKVP